MAPKSEVQIEELAGQKRLLRLMGAALPKQGTPWTGKNRLVTTWYSGNRVGSQQVLGPSLMPAAWTGEWNTTRIIRTPAILRTSSGEQQIIVADDLRVIMESLIEEGSLLLVTWIADADRDFGNLFTGTRQLARLGRASDHSFNVTRLDDIEWSITWEWVAKGNLAQTRVVFRDGNTGALLNDFQAALIGLDSAADTQIQLSNRTIPKSANKFTLEQLGQMVDGPKKLVKDFQQSMNRISNRVKTLGDIIASARALPYEIERQAADTALTAVQACASFYRSVTAVPPEKYDAQQSVASLTRAVSYFKGSCDTSTSISKRAVDLQQAVNTQTQVRMAGGANGKANPANDQASKNQAGQKSQTQVHLVKQGETLISISMIHYKVPDGAADIAFANGLSLKAIPNPGKVLIIPPFKGLGGGLGGVPGLPVPQPGGVPSYPGGVGIPTGTGNS